MSQRAWEIEKRYFGNEPRKGGNCMTKRMERPAPLSGGHADLATWGPAFDEQGNYVAPDFITLTDSTRRNVSFMVSQRPERSDVQLLGVIPHCTTFTRKDLRKFAREVLKRVKP